MTKKLHILFLCGWYPSRVLPTNGDFIQRHAEAVALKHNVTVIHIISEKTAIQKTHIETKKSNGVTAHIGYIKNTPNMILKWNRFYKAYIQILKKTTPFDVVHLNSLYPFGVLALHQKYFKKKPFIISEHWTGYHHSKSKEISFFEKTISKFITKKAVFVCPVTDDLKNSMLDFGLKGNYQPIPNVVNVDVFKPSDNVAQQFTIIHVSSMLDPHKNISGMLHVAKQLEHEIGTFTWKFIGGSSTKYDVLIETLNFNKATIQFVNHLSQEELTRHLQSSNIFILFSNYENLPCVILEAFSCGIPVISSNVGGISEFFPREFGYLIAPKNNVQLLEKIKHLYYNPISKSKDMHQYVKEHFSKDSIAIKFSELYTKSLKQASF